MTIKGLPPPEPPSQPDSQSDDSDETFKFELNDSLIARLRIRPMVSDLEERLGLNQGITRPELNSHFEQAFQSSEPTSSPNLLASILYLPQIYQSRGILSQANEFKILDSIASIFNSEDFRTSGYQRPIAIALIISALIKAQAQLIRTKFARETLIDDAINFSVYRLVSECTTHQYAIEDLNPSQYLETTLGLLATSANSDNERRLLGDLIGEIASGEKFGQMSERGFEILLSMGEARQPNRRHEGFEQASANMFDVQQNLKFESVKSERKAASNVIHPLKSSHPQARKAWNNPLQFLSNDIRENEINLVAINGIYGLDGLDGKKNDYRIFMDSIDYLAEHNGIKDWGFGDSLALFEFDLASKWIVANSSSATQRRIRELVNEFLEDSNRITQFDTFCKQYSLLDSLGEADINEEASQFFDYLSELKDLQQKHKARIKVFENQDQGAYDSWIKEITGPKLLLNAKPSEPRGNDYYIEHIVHDYFDDMLTMTDEQFPYTEDMFLGDSILNVCEELRCFNSLTRRWDDDEMKSFAVPLRRNSSFTAFMDSAKKRQLCKESSVHRSFLNDSDAVLVTFYNSDDDDGDDEFTMDDQPAPYTRVGS